MLRILLVLCLAATTRAANEVRATPAPKGPPTREPPEAVAHSYIRAMADQRINVVADAMHSTALERFKVIISGVADALAAAPPERKPPTKLLNALFGDEGPAATKTLPARDVFVRFMTNLTTFVPQIREMEAGSEYQIIGHLDEGINHTHVVFRATLRRGRAELSKMAVLSLKREGDEWKVLLTDDLEALVSGLAHQFAAPTPRVTAPQSPPAAKTIPPPK
jgi:hypothetical protein